MKKGWIEATIEQLCTIEYGTRITKKIHAGTIYPVFGGGNETFRTDTFNREDCNIISRFGMSEQCTRYVQGKFYLNDSGLSLKTRDKEKMLPRFLDYLILHMNVSIFNLGRGTAQRNLDVDAFRNLVVPFTGDISEQKRVVILLDKVFKDIGIAISNTETSLLSARELFDTYRDFIVSQCDAEWEVKRLSDLCDIKHGYAFKSEYFSNTGEYVLLTPGNFLESGGYRDRGEKQKYYEGSIPNGFVLSAGDLLVAMTEQAAGLLGSSILVPASDKFLHNQRLGLVTGKPGVPWENGFFFHVFNVAAVRQAIHHTASGLKVRHTSPGKIGEVIVSFPTSVAEQVYIVNRLAEMQESAARAQTIYQQKLASLTELKQAILQKTFAGELTARSAEVLQEVAA